MQPEYGLIQYKEQPAKPEKTTKGKDYKYEKEKIHRLIISRIYGTRNICLRRFRRCRKHRQQYGAGTGAVAGIRF